MPDTWVAIYCREAWRLYDKWLLAAQNPDALAADVRAKRLAWAEHLQTCTECKREKTK